MTISKNEYVVVNIWTSEENKALKGVNCGHASLTVMNNKNETYISLWPGAKKPRVEGFFAKPITLGRRTFSDFLERPTAYQQDYEQDCILEACSEGHAHEVTSDNPCALDETLYRVDPDTNAFIRLNEQPEMIRDDEELWAVKLQPANFRMVLYSIDVEQVLNKFDELKDPERITAWTMVGSNLFTRNLNVTGKTSENCSSLVYRCLNAGGLFDKISSKLSLQLSSAVAPDDLLRVIVAAKSHESGLYYGNPDDWIVQGVDESSLVRVINAYDEKGQNANAEEDRFPSLKPSVGGCTIS